MAGLVDKYVLSYTATLQKIQAIVTVLSLTDITFAIANMQQGKSD